MAINTYGHRASVMPQFTPVDPRLVAFNPTTVASGMGDAFQLARALEQLKAQKALQMELEATRQSRIASQNALAEFDVARTQSDRSLMPDMEMAKRAGYQAQTMTAIPEAEYKLLGIREGSRSLPVITDRNIDVAGYEGERARGQRINLPQVLEAEKAQAAATTADAKRTVDNARFKQQAEAAQLQLAELTARLNEVNAPIEATLKALEIGQKLGSAKTDQELAQASKQMEILLKNSQIIKNLADSDYARGLGRQAGVKSPEARAKELEDLIKRTGALKLPDGRTLDVYLKETYNADGSVKGGWWQIDQEQHPVGETYKKVMEKYQRELEELTLGGAKAPGQTPSLPNSGKGGVAKGTRKDVVQNGQRYTIEWDGTSWKQVK